MLSFWESNTFMDHIDIAIIGSGIVGLSAAIEIKKRNSNLNVVILERGSLPSGASTKNAGFACFGSPSEVLSDLKIMSESEVLSLVEKRHLGLQNLISLLGEKNIGFLPTGNFETFMPSQKELYEDCFDQLATLNSNLRPLFGEDVYHNADHLIGQFGFNGVDHLIENKFEGTIDTGKMMWNLIALARSYDIQILNGIEVIGFSEQPSHVEVETKPFKIICKQLIVANNGFAQTLIPELDVSPGRNQVLVTSEIPNLPIRGAFHMERGYFYFRNIGDRILLGGGRHLEMEAETSTELKITESVQQRLENLLSEVILPNQKYTIESRWAGILGVGTKKTTIVKHYSDRVILGVRMGGMGVAIGSLIGKELATLVDV